MRAVRVSTGDAGAAISTAKAGRSPRVQHQGRRMTGIAWLLEKKRISPRQAAAGERFGALYRAANMEGGEPLRSCLDISPGGGGGLGLPPTSTAAEWIAAARAELVLAYAAIGWHDGLVASCELICGHGQRPREISTVQRETEEIENGLRIALDLLAKHFDGRGRSGA